MNDRPDSKALGRRIARIESCTALDGAVVAATIGGVLGGHLAFGHESAAPALTRGSGAQ